VSPTGLVPPGGTAWNSSVSSARRENASTSALAQREPRRPRRFAQIGDDPGANASTGSGCTTEMRKWIGCVPDGPVSAAARLPVSISDGQAGLVHLAEGRSEITCSPKCSGHEHGVTRHFNAARRLDRDQSVALPRQRHHLFPNDRDAMIVEPVAALRVELMWGHHGHGG
jgi:hypothetical protein